MNENQAILLARGLLAQFSGEFGESGASKLYADAIEYLIARPAGQQPEHQQTPAPLPAAPARRR